MTYKYEIWLETSGYRTVSIFVNDKEHIYEIPDRCFEIFMNNGVAVRYIHEHAGILSTGLETPRVNWDGSMEWITFESDIKLEWVVIIPVAAQSNIVACMEDD